MTKAAELNVIATKAMNDSFALDVVKINQSLAQSANCGRFEMEFSVNNIHNKRKLADHFRAEGFDVRLAPQKSAFLYFKWS